MAAVRRRLRAQIASSSAGGNAFAIPAHLGGHPLDHPTSIISRFLYAALTQACRTARRGIRRCPVSPTRGSAAAVQLAQTAAHRHAQDVMRTMTDMACRPRAGGCLGDRSVRDVQRSAGVRALTRIKSSEQKQSLFATRPFSNLAPFAASRARHAVASPRSGESSVTLEGPRDARHRSRARWRGPTPVPPPAAAMSVSCSSLRGRIHNLVPARRGGVRPRAEHRVSSNGVCTGGALGQNRRPP